MVTSTAAFRFTLAATHRVIHRIHHHTANGRSDALPATAPCLAGGHVHVVDIAHLTNRCIATYMYFPDLTGRHFHESVIALAVVQDHLLTSTPGDLPTPSWTEFNIVNRRAERNRPQGKSISNLRSNTFACANLRTNDQTDRCKDVCFFTV